MLPENAHVEVREKIILGEMERVSGESYGLLKWFIATLFAANSGALLALLAMAKDQPSIIKEFAWPFAVGSFVCVITGFLFAIFNALAGRDLAEKLWDGSAVEAETFEKAFKTGSGNGAGVFAMLLILVAVSLFVYGGYHFGVEYEDMAKGSAKKLTAK